MPKFPTIRRPFRRPLLLVQNRHQDIPGEKQDVVLRPLSDLPGELLRLSPLVQRPRRRGSRYTGQSWQCRERRRRKGIAVDPRGAVCGIGIGIVEYRPGGERRSRRSQQFHPAGITAKDIPSTDLGRAHGPVVTSDPVGQALSDARRVRERFWRGWQAVVLTGCEKVITATRAESRGNGRNARVSRGCCAEVPLLRCR
jgi:hypothetical protein